ncbi:MAG: cytochrome b/b6 domain-containing protein [Deltaproteobacteria bacterium]|nr:cytochrome b/b6 domain-containing protein [Deltaproteobacteria bacterium]
MRIRRFSPLQRLFHLLLIVSFLTQGSTGLARLYIETPWGKRLAWVFGGYEACRTVHVYIGIFMLCLFAVNALYLLSKINWRKFPSTLFGPDSIIPQPKDIKDFFQHVGWFLGRAEAPKFDRWGYWEKFDYWAVFWGIPILGITGLLMAYPLIASRFMPGWILNVTLWVHRIEAILAMGHVFIIHFFIAHLRRHNFPMDRSMFEGSVSLNHTRHEKPAWVERLEQEGKLESVLVPEAGAGRRALIYLFGYSAVAVGIFLLIGGLVNSPYITW